jgi:hypothetical protein
LPATTPRFVEAAVGVALKRKPANCGVRSAGGDAKEGMITVRGVEPGQGSLWSRWHPWHKREAANSKRDKHRSNCFELTHGIHGSSFLGFWKLRFNNSIVCSKPL